MTGETDLQNLLGSMSPELLPAVYVFSTLPPGDTIPVGVKLGQTRRYDC